ncbi:MAG TPA: single-stranded DNA-binding protein [Ktedonobacterales bacterium]|jgi:single-strand DNA-binding protein|nr:single-stranded DNA-binding protein [Ktedonobacterales bacterium]
MLNKIILIGNLGRDPEMTYTPNGKAITKFTMAVNRRSRDRETGDRREETTWFSVVAWDQLAETCNNYLHKGSKIYLEGRMGSRKYTDKDGIERTVWDVTAENMEMLDPKGSGPSAEGQSGDMSADDVPF